MPIINGQGRVAVRVTGSPSGGGGGGIVTNGLILNLDAGNASSYPGTGTTWTDLSGNGNNATLVNGVGYSSANGGSLVFDGSNDYANITNNAATSMFALQSFTLDIWVKPTNITELRAFWNISNTSHNDPYYSQHMRIQGGMVVFAGNLNGTYDGGLYTSSGFDQGVPFYLTPNNIYNITFVKEYNPNKKILYINGQFICSKNFNSGDISYYNTPIRIGNSDTYPMSYVGNYYNAKYYNRPLNPSEITQNFDALKTRYGL